MAALHRDLDFIDSCLEQQRDVAFWPQAVDPIVCRMVEQLEMRVLVVVVFLEYCIVVVVIVVVVVAVVIVVLLVCHSSFSPSSFTRW